MSPTPAADLAGCAAKMRRALFHMQDLDTRAVRFIYDVNPYGCATDIDAETGEIVGRLIKDVVQPPADEWGPIIGDAAHNLASALDHLICQLAVLKGGDPECDKTQFPIYDRDTPWAQRQIDKDIGALHCDDQRRIRDLQPYKRGNQNLAHADPLWLLRQLNVIDKHRRMHLVSTALLDEAPLLVYGAILSNLVVSEGTKAGDEVFRFPNFDTTGIPEDEKQTRALVVIKFGPRSAALTGRSVRSTLPAIFTYIRDNVFPQFESRVGKLPPVGDVQERPLWAAR